jgi:hypothetical protein
MVSRRRLLPDCFPRAASAVPSEVISGLAGTSGAAVRHLPRHRLRSAVHRQRSRIQAVPSPTATTARSSRTTRSPRLLRSRSTLPGRWSACWAAVAVTSPPSATAYFDTPRAWPTSWAKTLRVSCALQRPPTTTVKAYLRSAMRKLDVHNRTAGTVRGAHRGIDTADRLLGSQMIILSEPPAKAAQRSSTSALVHGTDDDASTQPARPGRRDCGAGSRVKGCIRRPGGHLCCTAQPEPHLDGDKSWNPRSRFD